MARSKAKASVCSVSKDNIIKVWEQVEHIELEEEKLCFPRLNDTMKKFAYEYKLPIESITAAFVALSPSNDYLGNLRSLRTLLNIRDSSAIVSTFNSCKIRALRFLAGEDFLSVTRGPKTRSFYINILDPLENSSITIDGHMYSIAAGKRMPVLEVAWRKFNYEETAKLYRDVANDVNLIPSQLQGVLWLTWKRIHGILSKSQLGLFNSGNHWKFEIELSEIKPYEMH